MAEPSWLSGVITHSSLTEKAATGITERPFTWLTESRCKPLLPRSRVQTRYPIWTRQSRAGNGVILITTKKGRAGKAQFVANASYSASWLPETIKVWGGNIIRNYNMNAYRNTVKPYQSANGKWVIPNSYEEVYKYTKNNDFPIYNYFFGRRTKRLHVTR